MAIKAASEHFVVQFELFLDVQCLEQTLRVSADSRLAKSDEGGFHGYNEGYYMIIDELLRRVIFHQHRHELHDIGVLEMAWSASRATREKWG